MKPLAMAVCLSLVAAPVLADDDLAAVDRAAPMFRLPVYNAKPVGRRWLGNQSPLPSVFLVRPDATVSQVHRGYNQDIGTVLATEIESALGIKRIGTPPAMPAVSEATPAVGGEHGDVQPASATT